MKLNLTADEARDILSEDNEDFRIIKDEIIETSRWSILHYLTVQRISDGKFFGSAYSEGATEQQDESPWEYYEPEFVELVPVEKTVIVYEKKKD